MSLHEVQAVIEQITSMLLAIGAMAGTCVGLWKSFQNSRQIVTIHAQLNTRLDAVERRSGHERRLEPRQDAKATDQKGGG